MGARFKLKMAACREIISPIASPNAAILKEAHRAINKDAGHYSPHFCIGQEGVNGARAKR